VAACRTVGRFDGLNKRRNGIDYPNNHHHGRYSRLSRRQSFGRTLSTQQPGVHFPPQHEIEDETLGIGSVDLVELAKLVGLVLDHENIGDGHIDNRAITE
jgi:hypothetical protein